ncbi:MAG: hypothetical protein ACPG7F_12175 [Aggregatilineales bacterium]
MKKYTIFMLATLMLLISALPIAALSIDEIGANAAGIPANVTLAATLRADTGYFETLDGIFNQVLVENGLVPADSSIMAEMDRGANSTSEGETFETLYRDWLGDTVTMFIVSGADVEGFARYGEVNVSMYSIADRTAAAEYITKSIDDDAYDEQDVDGNTLYTPTESTWRRTFLLTDDYLYELDGIDVEKVDAALAFLLTEDTLADNENYQASVAGLPGDDYNILLYLNLPQIFTQIDTDEMNDELGFMGLDGLLDMNNAFGAVGAQVWGLTIADGQSLTMDIAQVINDTDALHNITIGQFEKDVLDLDFARYVPADAAVVVHDSGIGHAVTDVFDLLETLGEALDDRFEPDFDDGRIGRPGVPTSATLLVDDSVSFMKLAFKGLTGQTLEDGIGWMNGNYAVYGRVVDYDNELDGIGVDAGIIIENTDNDALEAFIAGQRNALRDLYLDYTETDNSLNITWLSDIARRVFPESEDIANNVDILLGWNDEVLVGGARPGVELVLDGATGLSEDETFQAAAAHILDNPQTIAYINFAQLESGVAYLENVAAGYPTEIGTLLAELQSATISSSFDDESGVLLGRLVLTLNN